MKTPTTTAGMEALSSNRARAVAAATAEFFMVPSRMKLTRAALFTLRYAHGAIGTIDNSRKAVYGYDQRVEVFGSEGTVVVSNNKPDAAEWSTADGAHSSLPLFFFMERYIDSYIAEMRAFIECIQRDKTPPVTGIDGRIPVVMGYAARKSYAENRPVKLSEIDAAMG